MATSPDSNSHSNGSSSLGTESVSSLHRGGAPFYRIFGLSLFGVGEWVGGVVLVG